MIQNYVSGLPFPLLDLDDPPAGRKVGWNLRSRDRADSLQSWGITTLLNGSGTVERALSSLYMRMYGMHRVNAERNVADWVRAGILYKDYSITLSPTDMEGAQSLGRRHNDDTVGDDQGK
jgi:hypothetical protein